MTRRILALTITFAAMTAAQPAAAQTAKELKPGLYAEFTTDSGTFTAMLYEKYTPIAVKTFVGLAMGSKPWWDPDVKGWVKRPMYNGILFHRIVRDEMIQAGDPTGRGNHNCGFTNRDEFMPGLRFDGPGRLAVANTGGENTGGCQFFVTVQAIPSWNGKYTIFGQIVEGQDVVDKLNRVKTANEKPVQPVRLNNVLVKRIVAK